MTTKTIDDMLAELQAARQAKVCSNYSRPKGVMGGPCLNCGASQPEHADKARTKVRDPICAEPTLADVKVLLQRMIVSSEVYVEGNEEIVTGYKIKTGALHKLIGMLGLYMPNKLPRAK